MQVEPERLGVTRSVALLSLPALSLDAYYPTRYRGVWNISRPCRIHTWRDSRSLVSMRL